MRVHARDPRARQVARVTLNGEDVTARCVMADEEKGEVELQLIDADGRQQRVHDLVQLETRNGEVVIVMKSGVG